VANNSFRNIQRCPPGNDRFPFSNDNNSCWRDSPVPNSSAVESNTKGKLDAKT
jgi:hypothetical protein